MSERTWDSLTEEEQQDCNREAFSLSRSSPGPEELGDP